MANLQEFTENSVNEKTKECFSYEIEKEFDSRNLSVLNQRNKTLFQMSEKKASSEVKSSRFRHPYNEPLVQTADNESVISNSAIHAPNRVVLLKPNNDIKVSTVMN